jgi:hypothetical protein
MSSSPFPSSHCLARHGILARNALHLLKSFTIHPCEQVVFPDILHLYLGQEVQLAAVKR